jgi:hypothetical protein
VAANAQLLRRLRLGPEEPPPVAVQGVSP